MSLRRNAAVVAATLITAGLPLHGPRAAEPPFEFFSGDRVVFLGNTLVERAQTYAYLETLLTVLHPDSDLTFRNLGWSGDNVFGHSRSVFAPLEEGFAQLEAQVRESAPSVVFVSYGTNEAFWGAEGLPRFREGLTHLLEMLVSTDARIVIVSPVKRQPAPAPLPDPAAHNRILARYVEALAETASAGGHGFVNLFSQLVQKPGEPPLSDNTLHLTSFGYWKAARVILEALGHTLPSHELNINAAGVRSPRQGALRTSDFSFQAEAVTFRTAAARLPANPSPHGEDGFVVRYSGLAPGRYTLRIDGQTVTTATAAQWARGITTREGGTLAVVEEIRRRSIRKNYLYFHRYRPANWPYLFGFRKHEQGQNAAEIPNFDPLIEEEEKTIARLRKPRRHLYSLTSMDAERGAR